MDLPVAMKSLLSNIDEPTSVPSIDRYIYLFYYLAYLEKSLHILHKFFFYIFRINNPVDETAQKPVNIMSVKESVYQLQKKKISKEYPWDVSISMTFSEVFSMLSI